MLFIRFSPNRKKISLLPYLYKIFGIYSANKQKTPAIERDCCVCRFWTPEAFFLWVPTAAITEQLFPSDKICAPAYRKRGSNFGIYDFILPPPLIVRCIWDKFCQLNSLTINNFSIIRKQSAIPEELFYTVLDP